MAFQKINTNMLLSLFIIIIASLTTTTATRYSVSNWPNNFADYGDSVEFFYLLAPFPYNVPENITIRAGDGWNSYGAFHAGIGAWNTNTNSKISIELVANDYVGALFPVYSSSGALVWNNSASIVITDPLVTSDWMRSTSITSTSGVAFSELVNFLQDKSDTSSFNIYQPVSVFAAAFNDEDPKLNYSSVEVEPVNSFTFAATLINELNSYGCNMETFLDDLAASTFAYEAVAGTPLVPISNQDANVIAWYQSLQECYTSYFMVTTDALTFLNNIKTCYYSSPVAYIYATPLTVSQITLMNYTAPYTAYNSPYAYTLQFELPPAPVSKVHDFTVVDYVTVLVFVIAVALSVRWVVITKVLNKGGSKLKVDLDGDAIAERAVWEMHRRNRDSSDENNSGTGAGGVGDVDNQGRLKQRGSFDMEYYYYRGVTMVRQSFSVNNRRSWLEFLCCVTPKEEPHRSHSFDSETGVPTGTSTLHCIDSVAPTTQLRDERGAGTGDSGGVAERSAWKAPTRK